MTTSTRTPIVQGARVTYTRRFFGDNMLESVLFLFTLGIGWFIWLAIVAPRGQTPAKQLLNVRILDNETGQLASTGQVWLREFVGKWLIQAIISVIGVIIFDDLNNGSNLGGLYSLVGSLMILARSDDRAIWDLVAKTRVGYFPNGIDVPVEGGFPTPSGETSPSQRLLELDALRQNGSITEAEYLQKRREILESI